MYKKIMVPLDGSKLAESVLPHVEAIAKGTKAEEVILVSVTERVLGYRPVTDYSQPTEEKISPRGSRQDGETSPEVSQQGSKGVGS
jgi:nucleotide-binding universal stress UspA family protein